MAVCQADRPQPRLDPARWRESLGDYCRELRGWYRSHRGMPALARTEDLTYLVAPGHPPAGAALARIDFSGCSARGGAVAACGDKAGVRVRRARGSWA
ncbi:hypothetical protein [Nonomuraea jabiensis]|uniref:hypothetical protein n=1 Tax=Nonomuraea jabiensis TaxID=882448 RepID=UPI003D729154